MARASQQVHKSSKQALNSQMVFFSLNGTSGGCFNFWQELMWFSQLADFSSCIRKAGEDLIRNITSSVGQLSRVMARASTTAVSLTRYQVGNRHAGGGWALQWCHQALRAPHPWPCDPQHLSLCPWVYCPTDITYSHNCAQWEERRSQWAYLPAPVPALSRDLPRCPSKIPLSSQAKNWVSSTFPGSSP